MVIIPIKKQTVNDTYLCKKINKECKRFKFLSYLKCDNYEIFKHSFILKTWQKNLKIKL